MKLILEGNHVKRAEAAHLVTLQCLFNLYQEAFLNQEAGQCKEHLMQLAKQLEEGCSSGEKREMAEIHKGMVDTVKSMDIMKRWPNLTDNIPRIRRLRFSGTICV